MSADQKGRIKPRPVKRLGIIAGGGALPRAVADACDQRGVEPFIVALNGQTDSQTTEGYNHVWLRMGAAAQIIETLKAHQIEDLVLIGSIRRPSVLELRPDLKAALFFAKAGMTLGDNGLLESLHRFLQSEGFKLHGAQDFIQDLIPTRGILGTHKPAKSDWVSIRRGISLSQEIGRLDIGQSLIIQEGLVLCVEAAEGTDEMIARSVHLRREGRGGILIKTCKPQQTRLLDLPTIGPDTIARCLDAGLVGVVIQAGHSLIVDQERCVDMANAGGLFLCAENLDLQQDQTL